MTDLNELKMYSIQEAAEVLGISTQTVIRYAKAGKFPAQKIARKWKVTGADLKEWITERGASAPSPSAVTPGAAGADGNDTVERYTKIGKSFVMLIYSDGYRLIVDAGGNVSVERCGNDMTAAHDRFDAAVKELAEKKNGKPAEIII